MADPAAPRHPSPSRSSARRTTPASRPPTPPAARRRAPTTWKPPSSPPTRPLLTIRRAAESLPSSRTHTRPPPHPRRQARREQEAASPGWEGAGAFPRVAVQPEPPEVGAALPEALHGVVATTRPESPRLTHQLVSANVTPLGSFGITHAVRCTPSAVPTSIPYCC